MNGKFRPTTVNSQPLSPHCSRGWLVFFARVLEDRAEEVEFASTLPAHALRNLFKHSAVHLNVNWRDLTTLQWTINVAEGKGETVEVSNIPFRRAKFVWDHSILLNAGGSTNDFPPGTMTDQRV